MPITEDVYSVFLDGRPIERGLTKARAYAEAERLARQRPWEKTPRWMLPVAQPCLIDDSPAGEALRFIMNL